MMGPGVWAIGLVPAYVFYCTTGGLLIIEISKNRKKFLARGIRTTDIRYIL